MSSEDRGPPLARPLDLPTPGLLASDMVTVCCQDSKIQNVNLDLQNGGHVNIALSLSDEQ